MNTPVTGFAFNLVYVDDLAKALAFYEKHFGFQKKFDMDNGTSCYGKAGEIGLWIGGGHKRVENAEKHTRTSIMYSVKSAHAFFKQLKDDGVQTIHPEPKNMGEGDYWFQFYDPAGNVLDVLGGE